MTKTIEDLFFYCSIATDVFLLIFFLLYRPHFVGRDIKLLALYTLMSILINLFIDLLPDNLTYPTFSLYTFLEQLAFSLFLYLNIKNRNWKKGILISCLAFFLFLIIYQILIQQGLISFPKAIDSIPIGVETILVLIFSFYYLYEQMNDIGNGFIYSRYHFWIVLGFTLYLAGSFFIYVFAGQAEPKVLHQYWFLTNIFYMVKNILFILGMKIFIDQKKRGPHRNENYRPYLN